MPVTSSPECDLSGNDEDHPYGIRGNTVVSNSHPSKIDDLTGQGGAPPAEMARNSPAACSLAQGCDQLPWRNRELTLHVQNVVRRLEQAQQRFEIVRDNVLSKFFTTSPLQDINTLDVSTDWS